MVVDPDRARFTHEHAGTTYYFCCGGCQTAFRTRPEAFLQAAGAAAGDEPGDSGAAGDHAEHGAASGQAGGAGHLRLPDCAPRCGETEPVPCPKCGMALQPDVPDVPGAAGAVTYTCPMHPEGRARRARELPRVRDGPRGSARGPPRSRRIRSSRT